MTQAPWWKGKRGEWYVVAQVGLFALVLLGPRNLPGAAPWPDPYALVATFAGAVLALVGGALSFAALFRLGPNLTPLPFPKAGSVLVESGPYSIVRHPIYSGLVFAACGWALVVHGSLTVLYALVLFVFFDIKSRKEERWLSDKFPEYGDYQHRVRKLVPFLY
jgi:protein-S-isoprenylcysteine O-methyltransferase Ste14